MLTIVDDLKVNDRSTIGEIEVYGVSVFRRLVNQLHSHFPNESLFFVSSSAKVLEESASFSFLETSPGNEVKGSVFSTRNFYRKNEKGQLVSVFEIKSLQDLGSYRKELFKDINKAAPLSINFPLKYLYRPLGRWMLPFLAWADISPNVVTILTGILAAVSAWILGLSFSYATILAVILMQIAHGLDCADGRLARLKLITSPFGQFLDSIFDTLKINIFYFGMAAAYFLRTDDWRIWPLFAVAILADFMMVYSEIQFQKIFSSPRTSTVTNLKAPSLSFRKIPSTFFRFLETYEGRLFTASFAALFLLEDLYFVIFILFLGVSWCRSLYRAWKMAKA